MTTKLNDFISNRILYKKTDIIIDYSIPNSIELKSKPRLKQRSRLGLQNASAASFKTPTTISVPDITLWNTSSKRLLPGPP